MAITRATLVARGAVAPANGRRIEIGWGDIELAACLVRTDERDAVDMRMGNARNGAELL